MSANTNPTPVPVKKDDPILIDAVAAAALCGVSRTQWYKLTSTGKTPAPVRLGNCVRWNRSELTRWIRAGCPARAKWEIMRNKK